MDIVHHSRYRSIKFNTFSKLSEVANLILRTIYRCYGREKLGFCSRQKYVRTMGQTVEKVILTTVYIWKTTYNPVYMDNRAYLEIA